MDSIASRYAIALLSIAREENKIKDYIDEVSQIIDIFDKNNEFHNNMKFRETRPKSRYDDKIFNRYWESIITEPKTVFDKNAKKPLNKLNIEIEKDFDDLKRQTQLNKQKQKPKQKSNQKSIKSNNDITPMDKIMQGDRNLYKFPQINWDLKTNVFFSKTIPIY